MLQKQKAREENKMVASDVENIHQICLDMKYLTEEEIETSLKYFDNNHKDTHEVKRIVSKNDKRCFSCFNFAIKVCFFIVQAPKNLMKEKTPLIKRSLLPTLENFSDLPKK